MMAMNAQASGPVPTNRGRQHRVRLPDPYRFQAGGELRAASLAVETWGTLNAAHDNAILLFTGLSASAHAASTAEDPTAGWWEDLIGPGKALDTDRYFIVCANTLGSCFGSSGPGDIDPATARPYGYTWPELRVEDIARSAQVAVEHFGIDTLYAAIGASLGGMSVLAHAALFPGKARRLASLSGTMAASAFAIATRALQREMVGTALAGGAIDLGLAFRFARKVGMLSYIGAALLENRFAHTSGSQPAGASGTHFEVESWLDHQAQKFAARFDPWSFWYISRAMDLFEFRAFGHEPAAGSTHFGLRLDQALVIGVHEDQLFPLGQQAEIAAMLKAEHVPTRYIDLSSPYGHDAFLVEDRMFAPLLTEFLDGAAGPRDKSPF
jgi:homoserine O-acetyltransferase/O-succinyltransferase